MIKLAAILIIIFYFQLTPDKILAQSSFQDSNTYDPPVRNAIDFYYKFVGQNAHLYNGSKYEIYDAHIKGDPFFLPSMQSGSLFYDGMMYSNIPMLYDILHDELIINRHGQIFMIRLVNEKTEHFSLGSHYFIRIVQDTTNNPTIETGFYDRLYEGAVTVLAKRKKRIEETVLAEGVSSRFLEEDRFYIMKDNVYHIIRNKRAALDIFKDRKKDIQKSLRKNKIKFRKTPEYAIIKMAEFFDQIKN